MISTKKASTALVGKLKSNTVISLHTEISASLWQGKKTPNTHIPSIPASIKKLELLDANLKNKSLSGTAKVYQLNILDMISRLHNEIESKKNDLDTMINLLPSRIRIQEPESAQPRNINFYSDSAVSYQLIYLLLSLDELVAKSLNTRHIGLINQDELTSILRVTAKQFRKILNLIHFYKSFDTIDSAVDFLASKGITLNRNL